MDDSIFFEDEEINGLEKRTNTNKFFSESFDKKVINNLYHLGFRKGKPSELKWDTTEETIQKYLSLSSKDALSYFLVFTDLAAIIHTNKSPSHNEIFEVPINFLGMVRNPNTHNLIFYDLNKEIERIDPRDKNGVYEGFGDDKGKSKTYSKLPSLVELPFEQVSYRMVCGEKINKLNHDRDFHVFTTPKSSIGFIPKNSIEGYLINKTK